VLQRVYKYGGQPFVRDYLAKNHGTFFDNTFGAKTGKAMMSSVAGSIIGVGEIVLLPLDVLKIKRQTNPEAFRGRGLFRIIKDEGFGLYRGWGWTAARNAPGSFAVSLIDFSWEIWLGTNTFAAIRRFCIHQGLLIQTRRLQQGNLAPELCGLHWRSHCIARRFRTTRCHQDPYSEPQL